MCRTISPGDTDNQFPIGTLVERVLPSIESTKPLRVEILGAAMDSRAFNDMPRSAIISYALRRFRL